MAKTTSKSKRTKTKTTRTSSTKKVAAKQVTKAKKVSPTAKPVSSASSQSRLARLTSRIPRRGKRAVSGNETEALRRQNIALGVLYLAQFVGLLIASNSYHISLVQRFLSSDSLASKAAGSQVLSDASRHAFDVNLLHLLLGVLLVAGVFHVLQATVWRATYEKDVSVQRNRFRWGELSITATLLFVTLAMIVGIRDVATLVALSGLSIGLHVTLHIMEQRKSVTNRAAWLPYAVACFLGAAAWAAVGLYAWANAVYSDGQLPTFTYWLAGVMLILCGVVALNSLMQQRGTGRWANYLYAERMYMFLCFAMKAIFVWLVFANVLS